MRKYTAPAFRKAMVPIIAGCESKDAIRAAGAVSGLGEVVMLGLVAAAPDEPLSASAEQARQVRKMMREFAKKDRFRSLGRVRVSNSPSEELFEAVIDEEPDLLLIEWPRQHEALGISLNEAMQRCTCAVALVRGKIPEKPHHILIPIRGGPFAELSLRIVLAISRNTRASVTALHIIPPSSNYIQEAPFKGLSHVLSNLPEVKYHEIHTDDPVQAILEASHGFDLVVLGATAQVSPKQEFLGPVAERILNECSAGVMVVKTPRSMPVDMGSELIGQTAISVLVDKWFAENTYHADEFSNLKELLALKRKQGVTISLALPALNEEETVGNVIQTVKSVLMDEYPILDEIVLMDSNSTDQTREIAKDLGVPVYIHQEILPQYGARRGKGEALWKSLYTTRGDIVVWIDTDIVNIHPHFVFGLIGPLLANPKLQFVKGFYRRPIKVGNRIQAGGGGRVTELTARPLLNLFYPELSGLIQPLSGEYGGRRKTLERLPFSSGYGVEIGLLIDVLENFGLDTIAQVDLRKRVHHNQPLESLSKMSFTIIQTVIRKVEWRYGRNILEEVNKTMKLIRYQSKRFFLEVEEIVERERPPMVDVPEYRELHSL